MLTRMCNTKVVFVLHEQVRKRIAFISPPLPAWSIYMCCHLFLQWAIYIRTIIPASAIWTMLHTKKRFAPLSEVTLSSWHQSSWYSHNSNWLASTVQASTRSAWGFHTPFVLRQWIIDQMLHTTARCRRHNCKMIAQQCETTKQRGEQRVMMSSTNTNEIDWIFMT